MEKNETLTAFIKYKRDQATKNRQEVLNALIDLSLEGALKVDNIRKIGVVQDMFPMEWRYSRNTGGPKMGISDAGS